MAKVSDRMRFADAKKLLDARCRAVNGKIASTNKTPSKEPNLPGREQTWWLEHQGSCPPHDSPRSKAYLRTYVEIGEPIFFASGIPLTGGFMHPDRAVMKALLMADCVVLNGDHYSRFELTQKGQELIQEPAFGPAS